MSDLSIRAARIDAKLKRDRLAGSFAAARNRVSPPVLARGVMETVKERASEAADVGVKTLRERPAASLAAGAVVLVFLARRRIAALFRRRAITAPLEGDASI